MQIAKNRLFLTSDRKALVHEDSPKAAKLYVAVGDEIPDSAVELFGLVNGDLPGKAAVAKEKTPGQNKEKAPGEDKGGQGTPPAPPSTPVPAKVGLDAVDGIGPSTAKVLIAAGVADIDQLAAIDPANPPVLTGWRGIPAWAKWVESAKALVALKSSQDA